LNATLATTPRRPIVAVVIAVDISVLLWAVSVRFGSAELRFPAIPVAQLTFLAVQLAFPRLRWARDHVLGPANVALLLFALQLVVIPTLISVGGLDRGRLASAPADTYINLALLLQAVSYLSYALGHSLARRARRPARWWDGSTSIVPLGWSFVAVGLVGVVLSFHSIGSVVDYFSGRGDVFGSTRTTLADAAGTFLRPFAAYGFIAIWCARLIRRRDGQRPTIWADLLLIVGALAVSATYSYNRAAVVVPVIALFATYSLHARRLGAGMVAAVALIITILAFQFGNYRDVYTGTLGGTVTREQANFASDRPSLMDQIQLYGNGPQFWAVTIADTAHRSFVLGKTIVGSIMLPVPILGKPFRSSSGPVEYNALVYGRGGVDDQILAVGAELYWNFGMAGVAGGYLLLGWAVRRLDERSKKSSDALATYTYCYIGVWVALSVINSLSVLAQILVYFLWPVYVMMLLRRRRPGGSPRAGETPA
jgi:hypothetical protein